MTEEGKILGWGLAKARKNNFDYEYITWKLVRSRGDLDHVYDFDAIKQSMGENKFDNLMSKTMESRKIVGNELLALEDYTLPSLPGLGEKNENHWCPTKSKEEELLGRNDEASRWDENINCPRWRLEGSGDPNTKLSKIKTLLQTDDHCQYFPKTLLIILFSSQIGVWRCML